MAPVPVKCIISFSSQDPKHPVENLVKGLSVLKWLGSATDRSGRLEATFQLQSPCILGFIDIGTIWTFSLQILVGKSTWSADQDYKTLLSGVNLMTPKDCRQEQNKQKLSMFKYDEFEASVRDDTWDRLRIILTQPFRKDRQMGISLLRFVSKDDPNQKTTDGPNLSIVPQQLSPLQSKLPSSASKTPRSGQDIERHFFGSKNSRNQLESQLKSNLIKIEGTAENGSHREEAMSRHAKLVLAAVSKTPVYKKLSDVRKNQLPRSAPPESNRKKKLSFEEEVGQFFKNLDCKQLDLATVTFADLRHKLEKTKCRKLSKEEKALFFKKTEVFINEMVTEDNPTEKKKEQDLGASPDLKGRSKKPMPSRSFSTPTQNLHLQLDATQVSASDSSAKDIDKSDTQSERQKTPKSTQELHLKLDTQNTERCNSVPKMKAKVISVSNTQNMKLQLEVTQKSQDNSLLLDESTDELKLMLDDSTEEYIEGTKEDDLISEGNSTLKEQKSFIGQVQQAFSSVAKFATQALKTQRKDRNNEEKSDEKYEMEHVVKNGNSVCEPATENDNIWLNAKTNIGPVSSKGNKRKSESSPLDGNQKRRKKTKGEKKETCENCKRSFSLKQLLAHKQFCVELSSDSEGEQRDMADVSSQIQSLLEDRRKGNDTISSSTPGKEFEKTKKSKKNRGSMETCPKCQKSFSRKTFAAHSQLCREFSSGSESEVSQSEVNSQLDILLAERKAKKIKRTKKKKKKKKV